MEQYILFACLLLPTVEDQYRSRHCITPRYQWGCKYPTLEEMLIVKPWDVYLIKMECGNSLCTAVYKWFHIQEKLLMWRNKHPFKYKIKSFLEVFLFFVETYSIGYFIKRKWETFLISIKLCITSCTVKQFSASYRIVGIKIHAA